MTTNGVSRDEYAGPESGPESPMPIKLWGPVCITFLSTNLKNVGRVFILHCYLARLLGPFQHQAGDQQWCLA